MTETVRLLHRLGARMEHHAYCSQHAPGEADSDCPFCEDRAAYLAYRRAFPRINPDRAQELLIAIQDVPVTG